MNQASEPEISLIPKKETGQETKEKNSEADDFNNADEKNSIPVEEGKTTKVEIPKVAVKSEKTQEVKSTLVALQGKEYTPGNAEKLQAARGELAEAAASVGLPYEAQQSLEKEVRGNQNCHSIPPRRINSSGNPEKNPQRIPTFT